MNIIKMKGEYELTTASEVSNINTKPMQKAAKDIRGELWKRAFETKELRGMEFDAENIDELISTRDFGIIIINALEKIFENKDGVKMFLKLHNATSCLMSIEGKEAEDIVKRKIDSILRTESLVPMTVQRLLEVQIGTKESYNILLDCTKFFNDKYKVIRETYGINNNIAFIKDYVETQQSKEINIDMVLYFINNYLKDNITKEDVDYVVNMAINLPDERVKQTDTYKEFAKLNQQEENTLIDNDIKIAKIGIVTAFTDGTDLEKYSIEKALDSLVDLDDVLSGMEKLMKQSYNSFKEKDKIDIDDIPGLRECSMHIAEAQRALCEKINPGYIEYERQVTEIIKEEFKDIDLESKNPKDLVGVGSEKFNRIYKQTAGKSETENFQKEIKYSSCMANVISLNYKSSMEKIVGEFDAIMRQTVIYVDGKDPVDFYEETRMVETAIMDVLYSIAQYRKHNNISSERVEKLHFDINKETADSNIVKLKFSAKVVDNFMKMIKNKELNIEEKINSIEFDKISLEDLVSKLHEIGLELIANGILEIDKKNLYYAIESAMYGVIVAKAYCKDYYAR